AARSRTVPAPGPGAPGVLPPEEEFSEPATRDTAPPPPPSGRTRGSGRPAPAATPRGGRARAPPPVGTAAWRRRSHRAAPPGAPERPGCPPPRGRALRACVQAPMRRLLAGRERLP